jgi:hypothetical protein
LGDGVNMVTYMAADRATLTAARRGHREASGQKRAAQQVTGTAQGTWWDQQNGGTMWASRAERERFIGASAQQRHEVRREAHVQMGFSF